MGLHLAAEGEREARLPVFARREGHLSSNVCMAPRCQANASSYHLDLHQQRQRHSRLGTCWAEHDVPPVLIHDGLDGCCMVGKRLQARLVLRKRQQSPVRHSRHEEHMLQLSSLQATHEIDQVGCLVASAVSAIACACADSMLLHPAPSQGSATTVHVGQEVKRRHTSCSTRWLGSWTNSGSGRRRGLRCMKATCWSLSWGTALRRAATLPGCSWACSTAASAWAHMICSQHTLCSGATVQQCLPHISGEVGDVSGRVEPDTQRSCLTARSAPG